MVKKVSANPLAKCMKEKDGVQVLTLPDALPGELAANVADVILNARNGSLSINAGKVDRIDTPCIQVLLSAARLWRDDGETLTISGKSGTFEENVLILGLTTAELEAGDANHA